MTNVINESMKNENEQNGISDRKQNNFICGVIEGFYGRPWTTEQRKDLFRKLKKWGMDSYVYAPKDDYKHRAYWRELYTVEEADHLTSLISAAKEHNITFYYALSPGLDMSYSNPKELQSLKRKLDQVSQFGCEAFALLFDDIESELSKSDKEVFQTFANAQVSITNEIYSHLGNPKFLFCPTQYCSSRAVPNVLESEYLNTLGSKLNNEIDIMWTGKKVITKNITLDSIQEITDVLRRPPVIWDNLHANDYDQKRVFLGPYSGRSPELIPHLRGVMTNPNCEFHANTIAIYTLAKWSKCNMDSKLNSSISADIKLETESEDGISTEELPSDCISENIYHPRIALKKAISVWLEEFFIEKEAWGPITKPQPQVTMVMPIIPIIPSINTCMSLTSTTTTSTTSNCMLAVPEVNTSQLQALADICSTVDTASTMNPISKPVMNSLVSPTKVITNDEIPNPISNIASNIELPKTIPISIMSVPIMDSTTVTEVSDKNETTDIELIDNDDQMSISRKLRDKKKMKDKSLRRQEENSVSTEPELNNCKIYTENQDVYDHEDPIEESTSNLLDENFSPMSAVGTNEPMECSSSLTSQTSPKDGAERKIISDDVIMQETGSLNELSNIMQMEESGDSLSNSEMKESDHDDCDSDKKSAKIQVQDLYLLCDLFYLPFEHGSRGLKLLQEFNWLKSNAFVLLNTGKGILSRKSSKPEITEWYHRAGTFSALCSSVQNLVSKISNCPNKEICHDLFSYIWDISGALNLLNAFVKWLSLGYFPQNVHSNTHGSYTWFSKGWKEAFMSGDQEPWVFRGGLIADLQRLIPVDSGNDLFLYNLPEIPTCEYYLLRPYSPLDEIEVNKICANNTLCSMEIDREDYKNEQSNDVYPLPKFAIDLIADSKVGPFITITPEFCSIAHDISNTIVGYAAAALDINIFKRNIEICWIPAMREKYSVAESHSIINGLHVNKLFEEKLHRTLTDLTEFDYTCPTEVSKLYPAVITTAVMNVSLAPGYNWMGYLTKRLLTITLAALRANGCYGVHVRLESTDKEQSQYYNKLGFGEIYRDATTKNVYMGRRF